MAGNCKAAYEETYLSQVDFDDAEEGGWRFNMKLRTEHVWDAFIIWTLHRQHEKHNELVVVPHSGEQKDRFTELMRKRNEEVIIEGQDEIGHYCDKCMRVWEDDNGNLCMGSNTLNIEYKELTDFLDKCQVVVTDGLTMGHPCCGSFRCTIPLHNNRDRFCPKHYNLHDIICAITDCTEPVVEGMKSCGNLEHQKMERLQSEKGKAAFTLKERLQRHRVAHPNSAITTPAQENEEVFVDDLEETDTWFESDGGEVRVFTDSNPGSVGVLDDENPAIAECEATKSELGNKRIRAQFGRRRTHNEQTLVRPCGVICARATFYGAEAVSNVLVSVG